MASLFFSYSRKDIAFARRLTEACKGQDLDYWIDWEGIPPTVDWWKEIEKGIEEADIFLFLLSPDSANSSVCKREIEHAVRNGKRLIPVVLRDVRPDEAPLELQPLNWIFLRENDNFTDAFDKLLVAIKTDYAWVQAHRQLQVKALEWEKSNKEKSFLLRGKELHDAEYDLATNSSKEPFSTSLQRDYVIASKKEKIRQKRYLTDSALVIAFVIAWLVYAPLKSWLTTPELPGWSPITTFPAASPRIIAMDLKYPDDVYVSNTSNGELYSSPDGGKTWHKIGSTEIKNPIMGLAALDKRVYVLTDQIVWVSKNGGKSWTALKNFPLERNAGLLSIGVNPDNGKEIFIGSNNGAIYHTNDFGTSWNTLPAGYDGTSINVIATNGFVIIMANENGLWVNNIEAEEWHKITLSECSKVSNKINSVAFTYPYSPQPPDGAYGFIAAVSGVGVCDSDSKDLHGSTLILPQVDATEYYSITVADQPELVEYEGYIASSKEILRKRIWWSTDIEWWILKIKPDD